MDGSRPGPSCHKEIRNESSREGSRIVVDEEPWDKEGDADVDIEREEEDQDHAEEDVVNVDEDMDIEVVGGDEFSSNGGLWLSFRRYSIMRS